VADEIIAEILVLAEIHGEQVQVFLVEYLIEVATQDIAIGLGHFW
jgi:hypothetical protein